MVSRVIIFALLYISLPGAGQQGWAFISPHPLDSTVLSIIETAIPERDGMRGYDQRSLFDIRSEGISITANDLFTYDMEGDSIIMKHDLLSDSAHYRAVILCEYDADSDWSAAGGCSILKDGSTYYVICRQRMAGAGGTKWQMWSSPDLTEWNIEWELPRDSVRNPPVTPLGSMEGSSLRKFNGVYYLYTCVRPGATSWGIFYVTAATISALRDSLREGNSWHAVWTEDVKDPVVMEHDANYYMLASRFGPGSIRHEMLLQSDSPTFSSWDTISCPSRPYSDSLPNMVRFGAPGIILFDVSSNQYIYWNVVEVYDSPLNDLYWFWTRAGSLDGTWTYVGRKMIIEDYPFGQRTARFFDYHAFDSEQMILIMEWDDDRDSRGDVFLWDYSSQCPLVCRIWAVPDTVIVGQSITLHMMAENRGAAHIDSLVPQIEHFGGGDVVLETGPLPPYADMEPGACTTFTWTYTADDTHWVWWVGCASGRDASTDSLYTSEEETSGSVLIQTPPSVEVLVNSVEPDTVSQGQVTGYTLAVRNDGESWLKVLTHTRFWYGDMIGDTVRTSLSDTTYVPGLADSVTLRFDAVRVPYGMSPGDWLSSLELSGTARNAYSCVNLKPADTVTVQAGAGLVDVPGSLNPRSVSQGQAVDFVIDVTNVGGVPVMLDVGTGFRLTDGTHVCESFLSRCETVHVAVDATLEFESIQVHEAMRDSSYPVTLQFFGRDLNGANYSETIVTTGLNQVVVETPARLDVVSVAVDVDTVMRSQKEIPVGIIVENVGGAHAWVDSVSMNFYQNELSLNQEYQVTDLSSAILLPGQATDTFTILVDVDSHATTGWVSIDSWVFGRDANSSALCLDSAAAQPDSWYVDGRAALRCSLWLSADTVMVGRPISLYAQVENVGGGYADSVSTHVNVLGSGTVVLDAGPVPLSANISAQSDTVFYWEYTAQGAGLVCWVGQASGRDRYAGGDATSDEDTSQFLLITSSGMCGDCNGDENVTVADAVYLTSHIYRSGPAPLGEGDVNVDGNITIADGIYLVGYIYRSGPVPCGPEVSGNRAGQRRRARR